MKIGDLLRRAGAASPLVAGGIYTLGRLVAEGAAALAPQSLPLLLLALAISLAALAFLFVVVTWFRQDDWLEAGVILAMSVMVGGAIAQNLVRVIAARSLAPLLVPGPMGFVVLLIIAIVLVPIAGGAVTLARIMRPPKPRARPAEAPERPRKFRYG